MWTHRRPYQSANLTLRSIELHGRMSLYRALRLGRVVAFVGSGVSAAYGGPSWAELASLMVREVDEAFARIEDRRDDTPRHELPLELSQLRKLLSKAIAPEIAIAKTLSLRPDEASALGDTLTTILALCEDILERCELHPRGEHARDIARRNLAALLRANNCTTEALKLFRHFFPREQGERYNEIEREFREELEKISNMEGFITDDNKSKFIYKYVQHLHEPILIDHVIFYSLVINNIHSIPAESFSEESFETVLQTLIAQALCRAVDQGQKRDETENEAALGADIVKALKDLKLKRFATLNYDFVLERHLAGRSQFSVESEPESAERVVDSGERGTEPLRNPLSLQNASGETVHSTILTRDTAGAFMEFAVHDDRQDTAIFHLHGRVDDHTGIILTEDDYRRRYFAEDGPGLVAEEAMRVFYTGNDVLFLGTGLKEDDVLGPLRPILSREPSSDMTARQTIALMPAECGTYHVEEAEWKREIAKAEGSDARSAIHQKTKYGINIIFFGRRDALFRLIMATLKYISNVSHSFNTTRIAKANIDRLCTDLDEEYRKSIERDNKKLLLHHEELGIIKWLIEYLCNLSVPLNPYSTAAVSGLIAALRNRVTARALRNELDNIRQKQSQWWDDWREIPRERKAVFHMLPIDAEQNYPVWIRHCPYNIPYSLEIFESYRKIFRANPDTDPWPQITSASPLSADQAALELLGRNTKPSLRSVDRTARSRTTILRFTAPRGRGKGTFLRALSDRKNQKALFDREAAYDGAFFAHMSFSTEFSSLVRGLSRFIAWVLAGHIASDKREQWRDSPNLPLLEAVQSPKFPSLPAEPYCIEGPYRIHRLELLRALLALYAAATSDMPESRIFICLAGLNRLCDEKGDAHNPMHRAFFRLLTGSGEHHPGGGPGNPPIDLVLIAGRPDAPIAYLSEERASNAAPPDWDFVTRSASGRALKPWTELPPISWGWRKFLGYKFPPKRDSEPLTAGEVCCSLAGGDGAVKGLADIDYDVVVEALTKRLKSDNGKVSGTERHPDTLEFARREFWNSIALSNWAYRNVFCYVVSNARSRSNDEIDRLVEEWLGRMSRAAASGGFKQALEEILVIYAELDATATKEPFDAKMSALGGVLLHHLALYFLPIEREVLLDCPIIVKNLDDLCGREANAMVRRRMHIEYIDRALGLLLGRGLLVDIKSRMVGDADDSAQTATHKRYVMHDQLREYFAAKTNLFVPDGGDRNHYQVSVYTDQPIDMPTPTAGRFAEIKDIVETQINSCQGLLRQFYIIEGICRQPAKRINLGHRDRDRLRECAAVLKQTLNEDAPSLHAITQRLRASYALLRGNLSIGALSRIMDVEKASGRRNTPFDAYREWLRRLSNAGVGIYKMHNLINASLDPNRRAALMSFIEAAGIGGEQPLPSPEDQLRDKLFEYYSTVAESISENAEYSRIKQPFYIDEISWILNERGLTSLVQGRLNDAVMHFDRALAVTVHKIGRETDDPAYQAAERRISLNRAIAQIEMGEIRQAQAVLADIRRQLTPHPKATPSTVSLYVRGYLALCAHITGNIDHAQSEYRDVLNAFQTAGRMRALAIFHRHMADAMLREGDGEAAKHHVDLAMSASSHLDQRDILHLAVVSRAKVFMLENKAKDALEHAVQAESYGRSVGLHRIHAEALAVRARIMVGQGDVAGAGEAASHALAICNRHGMRLRQLSTLLIYGEVLFARGRPDLARSIVEDVLKNAQTLHYYSKVARANKLLANFKYAKPTVSSGSAQHGFSPGNVPV